MSLGTADAVRLVVATEFDVAPVIATALRLCRGLGWTDLPAAHVATAASELANNLWMHSLGGGEVLMTAIHGVDRSGVQVIARDDGPGIADLSLALSEGFSTGGGLGCGLPGVRRLMDEFHIESVPGGGTRVEACKWWRR